MGEAPRLLMENHALYQKRLKEKEYYQLATDSLIAEDGTVV